MTSLAVEIQEPRAKSVKVTDKGLMVDLMDGRTVVVPLAWFPRLWHATPRERNHFEIFGQGGYIHWPDLDEDLTVARLLAGRRSGESLQLLKKMVGFSNGERQEPRIKESPLTRSDR